MKIDNVDGLTDPNRWNNVRAFYIYAGTSESPQLILDFELEISAYQPSGTAPDASEQTTATDFPAWRQNAVDDKQKFTRLDSRLNGNYDGTDGAALLEPPVSMLLINSLLKAEKTPLSPKQAQSFRDFVADCLIYITNRADDLDAGAPPVCRLQIPVSSNDIAASDLIKLSLALSFEAAETSGKESAAVLPAQTHGKQMDGDIEDLILLLPDEDRFAAAFERIFSDENRQMRVGTTVPAISRTQEESIVDVWAIKMGRKPNTGFYYEIRDEAEFYAPKPIAGILQTATVPISPYNLAEPFPGEKTPMVFSGVDLNSWANSAFSAIDECLSTARENASLLSGNSEISISLDKIRQHKQTIAGAVADALIPIFDAGASDEISLAAAREKFRQSLSDKLSNAFILDAVTVFKVSDVSIGESKFSGTSPRPPRFSGQPLEYDEPAKRETGDFSIQAPARNYSLSAGKIQHFKLDEKQAGDWRLPLLFSTVNARSQTALSIPLAYELTHLEYPLPDMPDMREEAEEPSLRIKFIGSPSLSPLGNVEFPVILRALPGSPGLKEQTANSNVDPLIAGDVAPEKLAVWDYSFGFIHQSAAQDGLRASIVLNEQAAPVSSLKALHPLFAPLAQFLAVYEEILSDFETAIVEMKTSNRLNAGVENAKTASKAFEQIAGSVAAGFNRWINSSSENGVGGALPAAARSFDVVLESGESGNARIDVINPIPASQIPPVIEFEFHKSLPAPDKPAYSRASYNYLSSAPTKAAGNDPRDETETHLSYETALETSERTIVLKGLNVFTTQNALGQIQVIRNATNDLEKINDSFKFLSNQSTVSHPREGPKRLMFD